ncbi:hypothetical protein D3C72_779820 [compost metagenome]
MIESGVQVPEVIRPWWDFWATVTHALWWPAWSAIFSAAALAMTIYLATAGYRQRRRSEATYVEAAAILADVVLIGPRTIIANCENGRSWIEQRPKLHRYLTSMRASDRLHDIDLSKMPTVDSLENFLAFRTFLDSVTNIPESAPDDEVLRTLRVWTERLEKRVHALYGEARKIGGKGAGKVLHSQMFGPNALPVETWWDPKAYPHQTEDASGDVDSTDDTSADPVKDLGPAS